MFKHPVVAIIGGGFCGTALTIQLINQSVSPLRIFLINKEYPVAKGIAFSSYNSKHVLNVPAAKMSLFPDDPDNFINWIKSKPEYSEFVNEELNDRFLPRTIYGEYINEKFTYAISNLPEGIEVKLINGEATDINFTGNDYEIMCENSEPVKADKIVLALGNFKPDNPKIINNNFYNSKNYFVNPWKKESVEGLKDNSNVLIIGTGLTMVDNVLSLLHENFTGNIYALSTNGYFPLSHKKRSPYTDILSELHPPYSISSLYTIFRKHIKYVLANGITGEAVVDAVRPKTQEIWLSLSTDDKIKFMAHIRHLWGVARHRLPKTVFDEMQELIKNDKLKIIAGRIIDMNEVNGLISVKYKDRKSQQITELTVDRVINCTGPRTDLSKVQLPLVINLLEKGMIAGDEMRLGINALPDGTVIQKDNSPSPGIFTIGSMLKGILWESTAVPELRAQAKNLAGELISQLNSKSNVTSQ